MTVYILAHVVAAFLSFIFLWAATALAGASERREEATYRAPQQNAPTPLYRVHSGDYSAWQASSIEGKCNHV